MLKKRRIFLAINSSISEELDQSCNQNLHCLLWQPVWYTEMVVHCRILHVTVSRSIKPVIIPQNYTEKFYVFLTKADIFT